LWGIAQKHQISMSDLEKANGLKRATPLQIGQKIKIPVAKTAPVTTPPKTVPLRLVEREDSPSPSETETAKQDPAPDAAPPSDKPTLEPSLPPQQEKPASPPTTEDAPSTPDPPSPPTPAAEPAQDKTADAPDQKKSDSPPAPPSNSARLSSPKSSADYVVRPGDNLWRIARDHNLREKDLAAWNGLSTGDMIRPGQRLRLASPETAPAPASTSTAAAPKEAPPDEPPAPKAAPAEPPPLEETPPPKATAVTKPKTTTPASTPPRKEPVAAKASSATKRTTQTLPEPGKPLPSKWIEGIIDRPSSTAGVFVRPVKDQIDKVKLQRGRWKYVVIHHSGTASGNARIFDRFHRYVRGWENGLAYHFVIGNGSDSKDGEIEVGSRWTKQLHGGHVHSEYLNQISIGICFVGDYDKDRPTARQIACLIELVGYLRKISGGQIKFALHREVNPRPTGCPGCNFPSKSMHQILDK